MGRTDVAWPLSVSLVLSLSAVAPCSAQQPESPPLRASVLAAKADTSTRTMVLVPPKATRQSWERFESEFGLQQSDPTLIRGNVRRAKYGLDVVTFATANFLDSAQRALELEYSHGVVRRVAAIPVEPRANYIRPRMFDDTKLKFDFDLASGKPRLGVRLVIPFGN